MPLLHSSDESVLPDRHSTFMEWERVLACLKFFQLLITELGNSSCLANIEMLPLLVYLAYIMFEGFVL